MLIHEIIIENFMSYEYARIPLRPGLNIVCGPNGSGKSSILLAISVVLGQVYTERSKKLTDLIRWGKENARVSLVFDNTPNGGKRPIPEFDDDYFRISRYINKNGNYWFEVNFQSVNKNEVTEILNRFGLDPDNMLIIMHQNTMEEFSVTNSNKKLLMFEEAIGSVKHRQNILEAQQKLIHVLSEEESIKNLLENAKHTLAYWRNEYERYQRKKKLLYKKTQLKRELIWAKIKKQENIVESWNNKIKKNKNKLSKLKNDLEETLKSITLLNKDLTVLRYEQRNAFHSLMNLEKEKTGCESVIQIHARTLEKLKGLEPFFKVTPKTMHEYLKDLKNYMKSLNSQVDTSKIILKEIEGKISQIQVKLEAIDENINSTTKTYLDNKVSKGILGFQIKFVEDDLNALYKELQGSQRGLEVFKPLLKNAGSKIETQRNPQEVAEEIKITNVQIISLGEISEDVEKMHTTYLNLFNELKQKAEIVIENRLKTLNEIEERKQMWSSLIKSTLNKVNKTYKKFLSRIGADGGIRLTNIQDVENTGLELMVGFKGAEPKILNSYTQSGGERSSATMAFLLALQQHLKSTFRAVDEFDIHLDPRNREIISDMLLREISGNKEIQHLTITPGQIPKIGEDVHIIAVQNVSGRSEIKGMS